MTNSAQFSTAAIFVFLLMSFDCKTSPSVAPQTSQASPQPSASANNQAKQSNEEEKSAEDFFTKEERLSYNSYEIAKLKKTVREEGTTMDVSYLVVKKKQKTVAIFDGPHHPTANAVDFGLFPFLGKENQLLVSITVPRGGRQWIADFTPAYRKIFDTEKWGVGREGADLGFIDIDHDGVLEITAGAFWYYVFSEISMSETPVADVIFKYDTKAKEYVPANHLFPSYSLRWVEDWSSSLPAKEGYGYLGRRVDVLLLYLYAGREKEGWDFFDRVYEAKDKAQVKTRIQNVLKHSPTYQYIRKHGKN